MIKIFSKKKIKRNSVILIVTCIMLIGILNKNNILKLIYPTNYSSQVIKYSEEYDVDKYLIYALIKAESGFSKEAISSKGALRSYAINGKYSN